MGAKIKPWRSLRTKVVLPVVIVMVLLMTVSMWLVRQRIRQQMDNAADKELKTSDAFFEKLRTSHEEDLLLRYKARLNESLLIASGRWLSEASPQTVEQHASGRPLKQPLADSPSKTGYQTAERYIDSLIDRKIADVILLTSDATQTNQIVRAGDPRINANEFKTNCAPLVAQALGNQSSVVFQQNGDRLFDVIALPIHAPSGSIVGTIVFGVEDNLMQTFNRYTHCDIFLLANRHIVASTDRSQEQQVLAEVARWSSSTNSAQRLTQDLPLGGKHFRGLFNHLPPDASGSQWSYVILSSYEEAWGQLRDTQLRLLLVGLFAILFGALVVLIIVRQATQPLKALRASAETIGSGDFSRRVEVRSRDEFGDLAQVFNQMTTNLKTSREELENTVGRLKTTQAQLVQSEKLSAIGEFVAGVAHELNNPLTSVMGFSELLRQETMPPTHREFVDLIHKSAQRCQRIVQSLLSFARRYHPERKPANMNKLIEAALDILIYQLRTSNIEVHQQLDPELPPALVDSHQIQQVLFNIINNARQAIEAHRSEGWIKITSQTIESNIRITIQDSGPGIPEENISKIFNPFFTTKEVGKGTGLGLSLCYGIIKEHGGNITPFSQPGHGATFIIELPATELAAPAKSGDTTSFSRIEHEGVGKRVLVIDDEEPILLMLRETLTRHGYQVDIAANGEAGLNCVQRTHYDITLCDLKMPGLNGQQVYESLSASHPAVAARLIFLSGDLISDSIREFLEAEKKVCLPKPFTLAEFHNAIKQVLAE